MANRSKFSAIAGAKCPRCRQGKMFQHSAYNLPKMSMMNITCSHCDLRFEIEVGFFWAAMYVSYAINIALSFMIGVSISVLMPDPGAWDYVIGIIGAIIILFPLNYRYSRVLLIYFFSNVKYDEKYK